MSQGAELLDRAAKAFGPLLLSVGGEEHGTEDEQAKEDEWAQAEDDVQEACEEILEGFHCAAPFQVTLSPPTSRIQRFGGCATEGWNQATYTPTPGTGGTSS